MKEQHSLDLDNGLSEHDLEQGMKESLKTAESNGEIGPRRISGWELQDVKDDGNCFYLAVVDQLRLLQHPFLAKIPKETDKNNSLRLLIQGAKFQDHEWAGDQEIESLAYKLNVIVAIADTRHPETGFVCYYQDEQGHVIVNTGELTLPHKPLIRLAATGNHFLSVRQHPALIQGACKEAFVLSFFASHNVNSKEEILGELQEADKKANKLQCAQCCEWLGRYYQQQQHNFKLHPIHEIPLAEDYISATFFYQLALGFYEKLPEFEAAKNRIFADLAYIDKNYLDKGLGLSSQQNGSDINNIVNQNQIEKDKKELNEIREKARKVIEIIKQNSIANKANVKLDDFPASIKNLYDDIAKNMFEFLKRLWKECLEKMAPIAGKPPCKQYAVILFGSAADGMLTPYSDIEWGILVSENSDEIRHYFQRMTQLMHFRILNLGETTPRIMNHPDIITDKWKLTSPLPNGLSFDGAGEGGNKNPLGGRIKNSKETFSLIQTPTELANYQTLTWFERDNYFPSSLAHMAYLVGSQDQDLIKQYKKELNKKLNDSTYYHHETSKLPPGKEEIVSENKSLINSAIISSTTLNHYIGLNLLNQDSQNFQPRMGKEEKYDHTYSVKHDLYRLLSTALNALAQIYSSELVQIEQANLWLLVDELVKINVFSVKNASQVKYALAMAAYLRLDCYLTLKEQAETAIIIKPDDAANNETIKIASINKSYQIEEKFLFNLYYYLFPLYSAIKHFCSAEEENLTDRKTYIASPSFYDNNNDATKGRMHELLYLYDDAIKYYEKNIKNIENDLNKAVINQEVADTQIATSYVGMARSHYHGGERSLAIGNSRAALEIYKKINNHIEAAHTRCQLADYLIDTGDVQDRKEAEQYLLAAEKTLREKTGEGSPYAAYLYRVKAKLGDGITHWTLTNHLDKIKNKYSNGINLFDWQVIDLNKAPNGFDLTKPKEKSTVAPNPAISLLTVQKNKLPLMTYIHEEYIAVAYDEKISLRNLLKNSELTATLSDEKKLGKIKSLINIPSNVSSMHYLISVHEEKWIVVWEIKIKANSASIKNVYAAQLEGGVGLKVGMLTITQQSESVNTYLLAVPTGDKSGTIKVWQLTLPFNNYNKQIDFTPHGINIITKENNIRYLSASINKNFFVSIGLKTIKLLLKTDKSYDTHDLGQHKSNISSFLLVDDSELITADFDGKIQQWNFSLENSTIQITNKELTRDSNSTNPQPLIDALTLLPDGRLAGISKVSSRDNNFSNIKKSLHFWRKVAKQWVYASAVELGQENNLVGTLATPSHFVFITPVENDKNISYKISYWRYPTRVVTKQDIKELNLAQKLKLILIKDWENVDYDDSQNQRNIGSKTANQAPKLLSTINLGTAQKINKQKESNPELSRNKLTILDRKIASSGSMEESQLYEKHNDNLVTENIVKLEKIAHERAESKKIQVEAYLNLAENLNKIEYLLDQKNPVIKNYEAVLNDIQKELDSISSIDNQLVAKLDTNATLNKHTTKTIDRIIDYDINQLAAAYIAAYNDENRKGLSAAKLEKLISIIITEVNAEIFNLASSSIDELWSKACELLPFARCTNISTFPLSNFSSDDISDLQKSIGEKTEEKDKLDEKIIKKIQGLNLKDKKWAELEFNKAEIEKLKLYLMLKQQKELHGKIVNTTIWLKLFNLFSNCLNYQTLSPELIYGLALLIKTKIMDTSQTFVNQLKIGIEEVLKKIFVRLPVFFKSHKHEFQRRALLFATAKLIDEVLIKFAKNGNFSENVTTYCMSKLEKVETIIGDNRFYYQYIERSLKQLNDTKKIISCYELIAQLNLLTKEGSAQASQHISDFYEKITGEMLKINMPKITVDDIEIEFNPIKDSKELEYWENSNVGKKIFFISRYDRKKDWTARFREKEKKEIVKDVGVPFSSALRAIDKEKDLVQAKKNIVELLRKNDLFTSISFQQKKNYDCYELLQLLRTILSQQQVSSVARLSLLFSVVNDDKKLQYLHKDDMYFFIQGIIEELSYFLEQPQHLMRLIALLLLNHITIKKIFSSKEENAKIETTINSIVQNHSQWLKQKNIANQENLLYQVENSLLEDCANSKTVNKDFEAFRFNFPRFEFSSLRSDLLQKAYEKYFPLEHQIDCMWHAAEELLENNKELASSLNCYIPLIGVDTIEQMDMSEEMRKSFEDELQKKVNPRLDQSDGKEDAVVLIQGRAGSGKSIFGWHLIKHLWSQYQPGNSSIPLFINLRQLQNIGNDCVAEALKEWQFNDEQIKKLKENRYKLIVFLDGYDEIDTLDISYQLQNLRSWSAKIIITCRVGHLPTNFKRIFHTDNKNSLTEVFIAPFNKKQRDEYLKKTIAASNSGEESAEKIKNYGEYLDRIAIDEELLESPFILKILLDVLPVIIQSGQSKITRTQIFQLFTDKWHREKAQELRKNPAYKNKVDSQEIKNYCMNLAFSMFIDNDRTIIRKPSDRFQTPAEKKQNTWKSYLKDKSGVKAAREGAPLINSEHTIQFLHKSLQDYYVATYLLNDIDSRHYSKEMGFGKRNLAKNIEVLNFLSELILQDSGQKNNRVKDLFAMIKLSRRDNNFSNIAANAATLLAFMRIPFSHKNLSRVHIPDANLSGAVLSYARFAKANLKGVNLSNAWLADADFSEAILEDVNFAQRPKLVHKEEISSLYFSSFAYDANDRYLITVKKDVMYFWRINSGIRHHTSPALSGFLSSLPEAQFTKSFTDEDKLIKALFPLRNSAIVISVFSNAIVLYQKSHRLCYSSPLSTCIEKARFSPNGSFLLLQYQNVVQLVTIDYSLINKISFDSSEIGQHKRIFNPDKIFDKDKENEFDINSVQFSFDETSLVISSATGSIKKYSLLPDIYCLSELPEIKVNNDKGKYKNSYFFLTGIKEKYAVLYYFDGNECIDLKYEIPISELSNRLSLESIEKKDALNSRVDSKKLFQLCQYINAQFKSERTDDADTNLIVLFNKREDYPNYFNSLEQVKISAKNEILVIKSDTSNLIVHNLESNTEKQYVSSRLEGEIKEIEFSPDGKRMAVIIVNSKSEINSVIVWNLDNVNQHESVFDCLEAKGLRFSPDSAMLAWVEHVKKGNKTEYIARLQDIGIYHITRENKPNQSNKIKQLTFIEQGTILVSHHGPLQQDIANLKKLYWRTASGDQIVKAKGCHVYIQAEIPKNLHSYKYNLVWLKDTNQIYYIDVQEGKAIEKAINFKNDKIPEKLAEELAKNSNNFWLEAEKVITYFGLEKLDSQWISLNNPEQHSSSQQIRLNGTIKSAVIVLKKAANTDKKVVAADNEHIVRFDNGAECKLIDFHLNNAKFNYNSEVYAITSLDSNLIALSYDRRTHLWRCYDSGQEKKAEQIATITEPVSDYMTFVYYESRQDEVIKLIATSSQEGIIRLWAKQENLSWFLRWTSTALLYAKDCIIQGALGVSETNRVLLQQLHATGQPEFSAERIKDTELHTAIRKENTESFDAILTHPTDSFELINKPNAKNQTPLHLAAYIGNKMYVEILLAKNAKFNLRDNEDKVPGNYLEEQGTEKHQKIIAILPRLNLEYPEDGFFHVAIHDRNIKMVDLLLKNIPSKMLGATQSQRLQADSDEMMDINKKDHHGEAPLYLAVKAHFMGAFVGLYPHYLMHTQYEASKVDDRQPGFYLYKTSATTIQVLIVHNDDKKSEERVDLVKDDPTLKTAIEKLEWPKNQMRSAILPYNITKFIKENSKHTDYSEALVDKVDLNLSANVDKKNQQSILYLAIENAYLDNYELEVVKCQNENDYNTQVNNLKENWGKTTPLNTILIIKPFQEKIQWHLYCLKNRECSRSYLLSITPELDNLLEEKFNKQNISSFVLRIKSELELKQKIISSFDIRLDDMAMCLLSYPNLDLNSGKFFVENANKKIITTPLQLAIEKHLTKIWKYLLEENRENPEYRVNPSQVNIEGMNPVLTAIEYENYDALLELLKLKNEKNTPLLILNDSNAKSVLHFIVKKLDPKALQKLFENSGDKPENDHQIDINKIEDNETVLYFAIKQRFQLGAKPNDKLFKIINYLIDKGSTKLAIKIDLNKGLTSEKDKSKRETPLLLAIQTEQFDVAKELLGIKVNSRSSLPEENRVNLNIVYLEALYVATENQEAKRDIIKFLLNPKLNEKLPNQYRINLSTSFNNKKSLLLLAISQDDKEITELLLSPDLEQILPSDHQVGLADIDNEDKTVLHLAVERKWENVVILILMRKNKNTLNIDSLDKFNNTPLFYAIKNNAISIIKTLLEASANVNRQHPTDKKTALHMAVESSFINEEIISFLSDKGANWALKDNKDRTAFHIEFAKKTPNELILNKFLELTKKELNILKWVDKENKCSLLHLLLINNQIANFSSAWKILIKSKDDALKANNQTATDTSTSPNAIDYDAIVNCLDGEGRTVLHWAVSKELEITIIELLLDNSGLDVDKESLQKTALDLAIESARLDYVQLLLKKTKPIQRYLQLAYKEIGPYTGESTEKLNSVRIFLHILNNYLERNIVKLEDGVFWAFPDPKKPIDLIHNCAQYSHQDQELRETQRAVLEKLWSLCALEKMSTRLLALIDEDKDDQKVIRIIDPFCKIFKQKKIEEIKDFPFAEIKRIMGRIIKISAKKDKEKIVAKLLSFTIAWLKVNPSNSNASQYAYEIDKWFSHSNLKKDEDQFNFIFVLVGVTRYSEELVNTRDVKATLDILKSIVKSIKTPLSNDQDPKIVEILNKIQVSDNEFNQEIKNCISMLLKVQYQYWDKSPTIPPKIFSTIIGKSFILRVYDLGFPSEEGLKVFLSNLMTFQSNEKARKEAVQKVLSVHYRFYSSKLDEIENGKTQLDLFIEQKWPATFKDIIQDGISKFIEGGADPIFVDPTKKQKSSFDIALCSLNEAKDNECLNAIIDTLLKIYKPDKHVKPITLISVVTTLCKTVVENLQTDSLKTKYYSRFQILLQQVLTHFIKSNKVSISQQQLSSLLNTIFDLKLPKELITIVINTAIANRDDNSFQNSEAKQINTWLFLYRIDPSQIKDINQVYLSLSHDNLSSELSELMKSKFDNFLVEQYLSKLIGWLEANKKDPDANKILNEIDKFENKLPYKIKSQLKGQLIDLQASYWQKHSCPNAFLKDLYGKSLMQRASELGFKEKIRGLLSIQLEFHCASAQTINDKDLYGQYPLHSFTRWFSEYEFDLKRLIQAGARPDCYDDESALDIALNLSSPYAEKALKHLLTFSSKLKDLPEGVTRSWLANLGRIATKFEAKPEQKNLIKLIVDEILLLLKDNSDASKYLNETMLTQVIKLGSSELIIKLINQGVIPSQLHLNLILNSNELNQFERQNLIEALLSYPPLDQLSQQKWLRELYTVLMNKELPPYIKKLLLEQVFNLLKQMMSLSQNQSNFVQDDVINSKKDRQSLENLSLPPVKTNMISSQVLRVAGLLQNFYPKPAQQILLGFLVTETNVLDEQTTISHAERLLILGANPFSSIPNLATSYLEAAVSNKCSSDLIKILIANPLIENSDERELDVLMSVLFNVKTNELRYYLLNRMTSLLRLNLSSYEKSLDNFFKTKIEKLKGLLENVFREETKQLEILRLLFSVGGWKAYLESPSLLGWFDIANKQPIKTNALKKLLSIVIERLKDSKQNSISFDNKYLLKWALDNDLYDCAEQLVRDCELSPDFYVRDEEGRITYVGWIVKQIKISDSNLTNLSELETRAEKMIQLGADLSLTDNNGYTPLHWAVENNNLKMVKGLLEKNPKVINEQDFKELMTPLHLAIKASKVEIGKILRDYGANVNIKNKSGRTPLQLDPQEELYERFLNARTPSSKKEAFAKIHVYLLADRDKNRDPDVCRLLENISSFRQDIQQDMHEEIRKIIKLQYEYWNKNPTRKPNVFAKAGKETLIDWVGKLGFEVYYTWADSKKKNDQDSLLRLHLNYLLNHPELINQPGSMKRTPLHWFTEYSDSDSLKKLIDKGANPYFRDEQRQSCFHIALKKDNNVAISVLLEFAINLQGLDQINYLSDCINILLETACAIKKDSVNKDEVIFLLANKIVEYFNKLSQLEKKSDSNILTISINRIQNNTTLLHQVITIKSVADSGKYANLVKAIIALQGNPNIDVSDKKILDTVLEEKNSSLKQIKLDGILLYNPVPTKRKKWLEELHARATNYNNVSYLERVALAKAIVDNLKQVFQEAFPNPDYSRSVLCQAIIKDDANEIERLLKNPTMRFLNEDSIFGLTALHWAVIKNNQELFSRLLRVKANINIKDTKNWTALDWADKLGYKEFKTIYKKRDDSVSLEAKDKSKIGSSSYKGMTAKMKTEAESSSENNFNISVASAQSNSMTLAINSNSIERTKENNDSKSNSNQNEVKSEEEIRQPYNTNTFN